MTHEGSYRFALSGGDTQSGRFFDVCPPKYQAEQEAVQ